MDFKLADLHDSDVLSRFLAHIGLPDLGLHEDTLGSLFLQCEDRPGLLRYLSKRGVSKLSERQLLANAISKLRRTVPLPRIDPLDLQLDYLCAESLRKYGSYGGAIGLLIKLDGTCLAVNESLHLDQWGAYNLSPVASYCKIDGPIVAEVVRRAPFVGKPIYLPRCDG